MSIGVSASPTRLSDQILLTRGVPPADALPTTELSGIAKRVLARGDPQLFQYYPLKDFKGESRLRSQIANLTSSDPESIFVGNGSLQVLDLISALLLSDRKKIVIVERPTYDRAIRTFSRHGAIVRSIPLLSDGIDIDMTKSMLESEQVAFIYIIPDFQNPTGITTSAAKRRRIAEMAAEYDVSVIEDSPYRELRYEGTSIATLRSFNIDNTIMISSLSKILAPGLRIGFAVATPNIATMLSRRAADTYLSPPPLCQLIAAECLENELVQRTIGSLQALFRPRWAAAKEICRAVLGRQCLCDPSGGYFVSAVVQSHLSERSLIDSALKRGASLTAGSSFFPEAEQLRSGELFLRLPFQSLEPEQFRHGVEIIGSIIG